MIKADKPQLHASALGMHCMEAFRRRYIEGEIIPPGIAAIVGTGTHRSIEINLSNKIETGELLPLDAVQDAARDGLIGAWESQEIMLQPEEAAQGVIVVRGQAIDKAVRLARLHHSEKAPNINPVAVERSWSLNIPGKTFELVGTMDVQEPDRIRDTKTSGKTPAADAAVRSVQLKTYALAIWVIDKAMPEKVVLDYLVDNKKPSAVSLEHEPNADDLDVVMARIDVIDRAMQAGIYMPVEPTHWKCSPKFCGYHSACRFSTKPKQFSFT